MSEIREILKNTKFEAIVPKLEATGHKDVRSFVNVKLIEEYLKNYVADENEIIELSGIITAAIEKSKKNLKVLIWTIIIMVWIFLGGLAIYFIFGNSTSESDGPVVLAKAKTVDQAKERIDWLISNFSKEYTEYCNLPKNSSAEAKFNVLRVNLIELTLAEKKCELLDYNDQELVGKYIIDQLKQKPDLFALEEGGMISCWK
jgi:hypothetical protein